MKSLDIDYFIAKFEAIPDNQWTTGSYQNKAGQCCALGFCKKFDLEAGINWSEPGGNLNALLDIFGKNAHDVVAVNDGPDYTSLQDKERVKFYDLTYGPTPKARILRALREIKERNV